MYHYIEEWEQRLNIDQLNIYNKVINYTHSNFINKNNIFLDGPVGTGKTVLLNVIASKLRSQNKIVLCVASTGIAALNYEGGVTAHSLFQLPLSTDKNQIWGVTNGSQRAQLIRNADLIIFDEAPMMHCSLIEILDKGLQDLLQNSEIFGGKLILFAGDVRQIPPIIPGGFENDVVNASLKKSKFWSK